MNETADTARTITLSYPADLSDWGRGIVEGTPFRAYLRRTHDSAAVGEEWAEFVGVGCCGDSLDVPLRIESIDCDRSDHGDRVDDGDRTDDVNCGDDDEASIGESTTFAFEERAACGLAGGWQVQSDAGP